jgi:hypothetical protein
MILENLESGEKELGNCFGVGIRSPHLRELGNPVVLVGDYLLGLGHTSSDKRRLAFLVCHHAKSLITHPATTTHQRLTLEQRFDLGITDALVGSRPASSIPTTLWRTCWRHSMRRDADQPDARSRLRRGPGACNSHQC